MKEPDVVSVLRNEYDEWISSLTSRELHAIRKYSWNSFEKTGNVFFKRLNAMLRGQYANENEMLSKYSEIISMAIKKHPIKHKVVCYRGSDIDMTGGAKEGEGFKSKQFISSSVIRSRKFRGRYEFVIHVPEGAYAAYIEKISAYPKQRELLIDKDTTFTVLSRKENVIELEVLLV